MMWLFTWVLLMGKLLVRLLIVAGLLAFLATCVALMDLFLHTVP